jgi:uncharacterized membrane protein
MRDSNLRSITKGVSWRIFASIDTFFLSWLIFDKPMHAGAIALSEVLTKIILYYLHERGWNLIAWGRGICKVAHVRSFVKGVTWRLVGSIDTTFLSWFITGNLPGAFKLGGFEIITKIVLFYLHERIWVHVKWGRIFEESELVTVKK